MLQGEGERLTERQGERPTGREKKRLPFLTDTCQLFFGIERGRLRERERERERNIEREGVRDRGTNRGRERGEREGNEHRESESG